MSEGSVVLTFLTKPSEVKTDDLREVVVDKDIVTLILKDERAITVSRVAMESVFRKILDSSVNVSMMRYQNKRECGPCGSTGWKPNRNGQNQ